MKLSQHFTLAELTRSDWAIRNGVPNDPRPEHIANLRRLAIEVLEPIRTAVGAAIHITSGYRNQAVNAAAGGAGNSAHMDGRAADFIVIGVPLEVAAPRIRDACRALPVGKLIQEFGRWIHVQIEVQGEPRRQWLTASRKDGATVYEVWA